MRARSRFRAAGDRAAARLRKRAEWAAVAAQRRDAHDRAYEQWITGALAPYRITGALDAAELYGPEVDVACGAREPACGDWEAGARYRWFEQLLALAALTHRSPDSFIAREGDEDLDLFGHHDVVPHQQSRARPMATPDHRIHRRSRRRMSRHPRLPRHPPVLTCPHEMEKNHEAPGTRRNPDHPSGRTSTREQQRGSRIQRGSRFHCARRTQISDQSFDLCGLRHTKG